MRAVATAVGGEIQSPWFTAAEAAAYLRIESANGSLHAFYIAYPRIGLPAHRFAGCRGIRFHQDDLDATLRRARLDPAGLDTVEVAPVTESGLTPSPRSNPDSRSPRSENSRSIRRPRLVGTTPRRMHAHACGE